MLTAQRRRWREALGLFPRCARGARRGRRAGTGRRCRRGLCWPRSSGGGAKGFVGRVAAAVARSAVLKIRILRRGPRSGGCAEGCVGRAA
eukprot:scaffold136056_cov211-Phaeocystis_antarctica.AAC.1